jgi:hypothetical protein
MSRNEQGDRARADRRGAGVLQVTWRWAALTITASLAVITAEMALIWLIAQMAAGQVGHYARSSAAGG